MQTNQKIVWRIAYCLLHQRHNALFQNLMGNKFNFFINFILYFFHLFILFYYFVNHLRITYLYNDETMILHV